MNTSNLSNLPVAKPVGPDRNLIDIPITPNTPIVTQAIIVESVMELNQKMIKTVRYARVINIICILDIVFGLCYSLYYPNFLFPILFSVTGYFGTKWFHKSLTICYLFYLILNLVFKIANFSWILAKTNINHNNLSFTILSIILYLIEIVVIILVVRFLKMLKSLLELELKYLRNNLFVQKQFICNY